ncbi:hypothetical protein ABZ839_10470 [Streptomyces cellulosae]
MKCDIATTHSATAEFEPATLSRFFVALLKQKFVELPVTRDGMVCADCEQWLNLRSRGLVSDV